jgi:RNA polymerase sigma-70 factor (ECF subfamily)
MHTSLEEAIRELPPQMRTVFLLREVEGRSTALTAALEIGEDLVKWRLRRARALLRERLLNTD